MRPLAFLLLVFVSLAAHTEVRVVDDGGHEVVLAAPARRIVSLAPHITETLFAAGAGSRIVATVKFADYPEAARAIPRVGDHALLDLEAIVALQPDLVIVWLDGTSERHLERLRKLGVPMYYDRPARLADIPSSLRRLGKAAGTEAAAERAARDFIARLEAIERRHGAKPPVRVFYQVWPKPLLTINDTHIIGDVIRLCGGRNVFADAKLLVPTLDIEAVIAAEPEAVIATGTGRETEDAMSLWRRMPSFRPTAAGNLLVLPTDAIGRHSPRILEGAETMCAALDGVRARRR